MRKITTTLVLTLIAVAAIAGYRDGSDLVLTTYDQGSFTVRLDGQMYHAQNRLELEDISPGRHYLRIDRKRYNQHGYGGRGRILYSGYIDIPVRSEVHAQVRPGRRLQLNVNPLYSDCQMGCAVNACTCAPVMDCGNTDPYDSGAWNADPWTGTYIGGSTYTGYEQTNCGNTYGNYSQYNGNWTPAITHQGFTEFRRSLQNMNFETAKLSAIQNQLQYARFTSAQTRTLMSLFSFDSSKLELAKMIYPTVVDPNRYILVAEGFTFNSTREELYHFMQV